MADTSTKNVRINLSLPHALMERLRALRWKERHEHITPMIRIAVEEYVDRREQRAARRA